MTDNLRGTYKINAEWHGRHKMPVNPTIDQRVKWHIEHARHCGCRPISGKILPEVEKRYLNTHQEFWIYFRREDHAALAQWAADCAQHVLPYFEKQCPQDERPKQAIRVLVEWINSGIFSMPVIREASLGAHAAAREVKNANPAATFAARSAGQAVATAHVPTHAMGSALYAIKAVAAAHPHDKQKAVSEERQWQLQRLPDRLRDWVLGQLDKNERLLPRSVR